jgi:hypothetical protein
VATAVLGWPKTQHLWPPALRCGTEDLRRVAGLGWKVIKGGASWEKRYSRIVPFRRVLTKQSFDSLCGEFWSQLVWAAKKTDRGEYLAAQRTFHEVLFERCLYLLEEEALLGGKPARPFARRAEQWMDSERLEDAKIAVSPSRESLFLALRRVAALFADLSSSLAQKNGWEAGGYVEIRTWLGEKSISST